ncbi:MAG: AAA family ATPase [Deltaproteobacteria bacterium]|nr:AAA family ATPase [Deltaproteobacteria bacterium]
MSREVPLGFFTLDGVLGAGGGGIVWRGAHRRLGLPVAVKVLPPRANRHALHAIKNEVQAVARLHHPHIITVLDAGEVDDEAARASAKSARPLERDSPYLVVELASGGDLRALSPPCSWGVTSDVLRSLLGALAHAHARGVVHRDLKPQNVLSCTEADVRPGLKLTDFGVALVGARADDEGGGTPLFMAPEQFELPTVDTGPWTDLYALGCLALWLSTGKPPFEADRWSAFAKLHKSAPPPPVPAEADAPRGFAAWVVRLLEKDPADRYRRAADADVALAALDPSRPAPPHDRLPPSVLPLLGRRVRTDALSTAPTRRREADQGHATERLEPRPAPSPFARAARDAVPSSPSGPVDGAATTAPPMGVGAAPVARSWRVAGGGAAPGRLAEAGLSLFALRPVPVVGRDEERDLLWRALVDVHERSAPRAVVLRGPSGVGKSRLAEWLSHRAHEAGAATILTATFAPSPGRADGFAGAIARLLGLAGVPADAVQERARRWRDHWLRHADLTAKELCALAGAAEGVADHAVGGVADKDSALVRLLAALGKERPLLVWLDDVHWARHALAFVERVLTDARELPVLFLCTAVEELCDVGVKAQLEALLAKDGASAIAIDRLDDAAADALCAQLVGRDDTPLIQALRRRTEGNPLFAVHIVRDWVQRGLLVPGQPMTPLAKGVLPELPDALHSLWDRRVAAALDSDEERRALELAAVLGGSVDLVEWETACANERIGSAVLDVVLDAVVTAGLARRTDEGLVFTHVLVRASIERRARDEERLSRHHATVAAALELLWGTDTPVAAARIGRHRLAAGDAGAALAPLFTAARTAVEEGDVLEAKALLEDWSRARVASGLGAKDARLAPALILQATVADREGRHDEARRLATDAAGATHDRRLLAQARRVAGEAATAAGDLDEAQALLEGARAAATTAGDRLGQAQALRALGDVHYWRGERAPAARLYREAHAIFQAVGRKLDVAQSLWSIGYVELERGAIDEARARFLEQRQLCRTIRDRLGEANANNALGELERGAGKLDDAELHYRAALRIATRSGLSRRWTFRLNLAHVRLARGDVVGAATLVDELLHSPKTAEEPMVAAPAWWITAVAAAERGDIEGWDRAVARALEVAAKSAVVEEDLAYVAEVAARAMQPHDAGRAARAAAYAADKRARIKQGA